MNAGGDTDGDQDPTDSDIRHADPDAQTRRWTYMHTNNHMCPDTSTRQKQHRLETLLRKTQGPLCAERPREAQFPKQRETTIWKQHL